MIYSGLKILDTTFGFTHREVIVLELRRDKCHELKGLCNQISNQKKVTIDFSLDIDLFRISQQRK